MPAQRSGKFGVQHLCKDNGKDWLRRPKARQSSSQHFIWTRGTAARHFQTDSTQFTTGKSSEAHSAASAAEHTGVCSDYTAANPNQDTGLSNTGKSHSDSNTGSTTRSGPCTCPSPCPSLSPCPRTCSGLGLHSQSPTGPDGDSAPSAHCSGPRTPWASTNRSQNSPGQPRSPRSCKPFTKSAEQKPSSAHFHRSCRPAPGQSWCGPRPGGGPSCGGGLSQDRGRTAGSLCAARPTGAA